MIDNNTFASRHIGPRNEEINSMLKTIGCNSLDDLITKLQTEGEPLSQEELARCFGYLVGEK